MPTMMAYHMEKGQMLRLIEWHLNRTSEVLAEALRKLRATSGLSWMWHALPDLWTDSAIPRFKFNAVPNTPNKTAAEQLFARIVTDWFGWRYNGTSWVEPDPADTTTGFWIGYRGDVEGIVRQAFEWAIELALDLPFDAPIPASLPQQPTPIELWWTCPSPWFEAWVTKRPDTAGRNVVSITFMTPSHLGSNVSETPFALYATASGARAAGRTGSSVPPTADADYEVLRSAVVSNDPLKQPSPKPRPPGERLHGSWVVTHEQHQRTPGIGLLTTNPTDHADFNEWGISQLAIMEGGQYGLPVDQKLPSRERIAVVAPSQVAGGVTYDGTIR